jgi:hypothetical protein
MSEERFPQSGISQIPAGRNIYRERQAFYKRGKRNLSSRKIEEWKSRGMREERFWVKKIKAAKA